MARSARHVIAALGLVMMASIGCRGILGIEVRDLDDCVPYCTKMFTHCRDQYASLAACLAYCPHMPLDPPGGQNTLACRTTELESVKGIGTGEGSCVAAGPSGATACGDICEAYCAALEDLCPAQRAGLGDCKATCVAWPSCGDYRAPANDKEGSIQCRMFHLTSAALEPDHGHCDHAVGHSGKCDSTTCL